MKIKVICSIKVICFICLMLFSVFVVGCSGQPSESDMRLAMQKSLDQSMASFGGMGSMFGKTEIHSVKKIGCKEASDSTGYHCDYEIDVTVPVAGRQKNVAKALFIKAQDGWRVVE